MPVEPGTDLRMLVCCVIVEDGVDAFVRRDGGLDGVEEADELLVAVPLHVAADDRYIEDIQRCEQRRHSMPLVVLGQGAGAPLLPGQDGPGGRKRIVEGKR